MKNNCVVKYQLIHSKNMFSDIEWHIKLTWDERHDLEVRTDIQKLIDRGFNFYSAGILKLLNIKKSYKINNASEIKDCVYIDEEFFRKLRHRPDEEYKNLVEWRLNPIK